MSKQPKVDNNPTRLMIFVSGMAGTGKSTVAKKLAKRYGLRYYSGGDALKELAVEEGYDASKIGFWESPVGIAFLKQRENDPKFDKTVDQKLLEQAKRGNVLLDSWAMPWLVKEGFKIWLMASIEKRAERVAKRDNLTVEKALEMLEEKESRTKAIFEKLYGFKLDEDFKPFHLVLDTDNMNADEVYSVLCDVVDNMLLHK